jgi:DNA-binding MarR family transcriptional regulator
MLASFTTQGVAGLTANTESSPRRLIRPAPVDADPSRQLADVLGVLDDLARVTTGATSLFQGIEQVTGIRVGEIQVLLAVAHGADRVPHIAARIGQPEEAVLVTVAGLIDRGLLRWRRPPTTPGDDPVGLQLTDAGTVLLEQSQAVQIRLLDTLVAELGQDGVASLRANLRALARVFAAIGTRTAAHRLAG